MIVDHYLRYLKWKEYKRTAPVFLPSRPIEETLENITTSYLYKVLKRLPKGGDIHTHEGMIKYCLLYILCHALSIFSQGQGLYVLSNRGSKKEVWFCNS